MLGQQIFIGGYVRPIEIELSIWLFVLFNVEQLINTVPITIMLSIMMVFMQQ